MYNLRYHLASLVGVFLALALGLILGGLVVQRGTVDRQQTSLVDSLKQEFKSLRTDNDELKAQNDLLGDFSADLSDQWISDRLVGRNVVVLANSGKGAGLNATTKALEKAGATPVVITVLKPSLGLKDAGVRSSVASDAAYSVELLESVATSLAAEWSMPHKSRPLTDQLVSEEVLSVDEFEPGMAIYGVVGLAAVDGAPDAGTLAILGRFDAAGMPAVAAESTTLASGLAAAGAEQGLSAFDTLDTPVGDYTLIALLGGGKSGFYGLGEGAQAPYPPVTK